MGVVVELSSMIVKPKQITGTRRNVSWSIAYTPATKLWEWIITVNLAPQVYRGTSLTEAAAQQEVDALVRTLHD